MGTRSRGPATRIPGWLFWLGGALHSAIGLAAPPAVPPAPVPAVASLEAILQPGEALAVTMGSTCPFAPNTQYVDAERAGTWPQLMWWPAASPGKAAPVPRSSTTKLTIPGNAPTSLAILAYGGRPGHWCEGGLTIKAVASAHYVAHLSVVKIPPGAPESSFCRAVVEKEPSDGSGASESTGAAEIAPAQCHLPGGLPLHVDYEPACSRELTVPHGAPAWYRRQLLAIAAHSPCIADQHTLIDAGASTGPTNWIASHMEALAARSGFADTAVANEALSVLQQLATKHVRPFQIVIADYPESLRIAELRSALERLTGPHSWALVSIAVKQPAKHRRLLDLAESKGVFLNLVREP
jgi:hypothetical protein